MEQSNKRAGIYLGISLLLAILIWYAVNNSVTVQLTVEDVPVEFLSETTLAERALTLSEGRGATVDLTFEMPRSTVLKFNPDKLHVTADLASVYTTGVQNITWNVQVPDGVNSADVKIVTPTSRVTKIRVDELFRNTVEIRCKLVGSVEEGYLAGTVKFLPETLELRGQQVDVMQVSYAQVTLNISDATSTIVELADFTLYDFADMPIVSDRIYPAVEQIQVTLPVQSTKEVPLRVELIESAGARAENLEYSISPEFVTLSGDASHLAAVDEIVLGTLAVEDLREGTDYVFDIVLPEELENLSNVTEARMSVLSHDMAVRSIDVTNVEYINAPEEGLTVTTMTSSLSIRLQGTAADLAQLRRQDVHAVADLSSVADAIGSYTVPVSVELDGGRDIGVIGSYQAVVRIDPLPEPEPEPELPGETQEGGQTA